VLLALVEAVGLVDLGLLWVSLLWSVAYSMTRAMHISYLVTSFVDGALTDT